MFNKILKKILSNAVSLGIFFMIFMLSYIFWTEYQRSRQVELSRRLAPDTHWVMQKFPVYFILGKNFGRINIDGTDLKFIYKATFLIQEFIFSPDGRFLVLVSSGDILLYDILRDQIDLIHSLGSLVKEKEANGLIRGVQWSPDSKKFCYELYRWSDVSSQDHFYVYNVENKVKNLLQTPTWKVEGVLWDKKTQHLYGYKRNQIGLISSPLFVWEVYALSLSDAPAQLIRVIKSPNKNLSLIDFKSAGIELYMGQNFSNRVGQKNIRWDSNRKDRRLGVDEKRFLYYQDIKGKRRPLFSFRDDQLSVTHLRWIPSDRYVMMTHNSLGVLVLDPLSKKVGKLISAQGFGWYEKNNEQ